MYFAKFSRVISFDRQGGPRIAAVVVQDRGGADMAEARAGKIGGGGDDQVEPLAPFGCNPTQDRDLYRGQRLPSQKGDLPGGLGVILPGQRRPVRVA